MVYEGLKATYNVLIAYERKFRLKHNNDGNYQQQYFYLNEQGASVCSSSTFCRMEKNELLADDELYEFAARKLGKRIIYSPKVERILLDTIDIIYECMERLEEHNAATAIEAALKKLKDCQDVLYYEEYIWQFEMMKTYFNLGKSMNEQQFDRICHTFRLFPSKYQDILMRFAYLYSNVHEMEKKERVLQLYDFKKSNFLCHQISCIQIECLEDDKYAAILHCKELEAPLIASENYAQLLTLYIHLFYLLTSVDRRASLRYIETALSLTQKYDYHPNRLFMLYINVGTSYLLLKEYEKSIIYLKKCCEVMDRMKMRNYLCICHCYHMLDIEIPEEYTHCEMEYGDSVDRYMYEYFQKVDQRRKEQNKSFILHKVLKRLQKSDDLYLWILKNELHLLATQTNRFKDYVKFLDTYNL